MKKIICFFIGNIGNSGGTERISIALANKLSLQGFKVFIISLCKSDEPFFEVNQDVGLYYIFSKPRSFLTLFYPFIVYRLIKIVAKENIDILVNVDVIQSLFSLPVKLFHKIKIIAWEHFNYKQSLGIRRRVWARSLSQKYADAIVVLTKQDEGFYTEKKTKCPVVAIPNFLLSLPEKQADMNSKTVVAIGRLTSQKFLLLLLLWAKINKCDVAANWNLNIVGSGEDKEMLFNKAKELDVLSSITFVPAQKDVEKYYINSSIYAMTSRYEGLPMVLIEAKSYGLPIVSFDCVTGPREIIRNNIDGFLIDVGDNDNFVDKVLKLMSDVSLREQMQKEALVDRYRFYVDAVINKWLDLLNNF